MYTYISLLICDSSKFSISPIFFLAYVFPMTEKKQNVQKKNPKVLKKRKKSTNSRKTFQKNFHTFIINSLSKL